MVDHYSKDSLLRKRKSIDMEIGEECTGQAGEDAAKRLKHDELDLLTKIDKNLLVENLQLVNSPTQNKSAAAKRQTDRAQ